MYKVVKNKKKNCMRSLSEQLTGSDARQKHISEILQLVASETNSKCLHVFSETRRTEKKGADWTFCTVGKFADEAQDKTRGAFRSGDQDAPPVPGRGLETPQPHLSPH